MKFRLLLFTFLILFLCGCEAEYNLDISDDYLETIKVISKNDDEADYFKNNYSLFKYPVSIYDSYLPEDEAPEEYEYYEIDLINEKDILAKYKFKDSFSNSRAANKCYSSFVVFENSTIRINTLGYFDCFDTYPDLESVTVNIKVPYEVVNHNASVVNNDVYTWNITRETSRAINIEFKNPSEHSKKEDIKPDVVPNKNEEKKKKNEKKKNESHSSGYFIYFLMGLFFITLFGIIIFVNKSKK